MQITPSIASYSYGGAKSIIPNLPQILESFTPASNSLLNSVRLQQIPGSLGMNLNQIESFTLTMLTFHHPIQFHLYINSPCEEGSPSSGEAFHPPLTFTLSYTHIKIVSAVDVCFPLVVCRFICFKYSWGESVTPTGISTFSRTEFPYNFCGFLSHIFHTKHSFYLVFQNHIEAQAASI